MPPQGFFGDPTSALLPATARSGANGNWFFGRKGKFGLSPEERERIDKEYKGRKPPSQPPSNRLRKQRARAQRLALAQRLAAQLRRPSFGGISHSQIQRMNAKIGDKRRKEDAAMKKAAEEARIKNMMKMVKAAARFGTISDSLSGVVKPGPPNMRTFPMLGAYPGEVGPGNTPGGTANNGSFPGTENSLMSYFFTYGRRRSVRKSARKGARRSARKKARRSVRRSMRRC